MPGATNTVISTLSLHDALPISTPSPSTALTAPPGSGASSNNTFLMSASPVRSRKSVGDGYKPKMISTIGRSEEHTYELQSHVNIVCRLMIDTKKYQTAIQDNIP